MSARRSHATLRKLLETVMVVDQGVLEAAELPPRGPSRAGGNAGGKAGGKASGKVSGKGGVQAVQA